MLSIQTIFRILIPCWLLLATGYAEAAQLIRRATLGCPQDAILIFQRGSWKCSFEIYSYPGAVVDRTGEIVGPFITIYNPSSIAKHALMLLPLEQSNGKSRMIRMVAEPSGFKNWSVTGGAMYTTENCSGTVYIRPQQPEFGERFESLSDVGIVLRVNPTKDISNLYLIAPGATQVTRTISSARGNTGVCTAIIETYEAPVYRVLRVLTDIYAKIPPPYDVKFAPEFDFD